MSEPATKEDTVAGLVAEHKERMDALLAAHTARIEKAQDDFDGLVMQANERLQNLIRQSETATQPAPPVKPQAVWSKGMLVLNREAAALIEELLSRTGEVLSEVGKLVSTKPK